MWQKLIVDFVPGVIIAVKFHTMPSCLSQLAKLQAFPRQHKQNSNFISPPDIITDRQCGVFFTEQKLNGWAAVPGKVALTHYFWLIYV